MNPSGEGRVGVLVMSHGTPATPEDLTAFYTRIRRGRSPTPELLADLKSRYEAIGGLSPMTEHTAAQVAGLASALEQLAPGRYDVHHGAKHTAPFIEDAAHELVDAHVGRVIGIVLTPHRSGLGSEVYHERAAAVFADSPPTGRTPVPYRRVPQWYGARGFASLLGARVRRALDSLPASAIRRIVLFGAHSLPERIRSAGDQYPEQLADSADAAASAAGLAASGVDWRPVWQSAGRTDEAWLGPDLRDVLRDLPAEGYDAAVVCPIGFVSDHLEILFDLDIEARRVAESVGLHFTRTASLNDDPAFIKILADTVHRAACDPTSSAITSASNSRP